MGVPPACTALSANDYLPPTHDRHPDLPHATHAHAAVRSRPLRLTIRGGFVRSGPAAHRPRLSQSATNFNTQLPHPQPPLPSSAKASGRRQRGTGPVSHSLPLCRRGRARAYVASLSAVFSMRDRATDPFGHSRIPNAKPVIKNPVAKTTRRVAPVQATPFADIIRLIKVTTSCPGKNVSWSAPAPSNKATASRSSSAARTSTSRSSP